MRRTGEASRARFLALAATRQRDPLAGGGGRLPTDLQPTGRLEVGARGADVPDEMVHEPEIDEIPRDDALLGAVEAERKAELLTGPGPIGGEEESPAPKEVRMVLE